MNTRRLAGDTIVTIVSVVLLLWFSRRKGPGIEFKPYLRPEAPKHKSMRLHIRNRS